MEIVQDADNVSAVQNDLKKEASVDVNVPDSTMNAAPTPTYIPSSPPQAPASMSLGMNGGGASPNGTKSDSEAETVLLPGVDGYSPSKSRKVKLEDKTDDNGVLSGIDENTVAENGTSGANGTAPSSLGKRKRSKNNGNVNGNREHQRTGNSSGLSSVPTSPIATTRSSLSKPAESDSDVSRSPSPRREKKARSQARHTPSVEDEHAASQEDKDQRSVRKQKSTGPESRSHLKHPRTSQSTSKIDYHAQDRTRSVSPASQTHRRSVSTQPSGSASANLGHKKKKVPAPLRATRERHNLDGHSEDDSSTGESPYPRRSRTRNLATPPTGDSSASLAKMGKKRRMQYGLSSLAAACEHGDLKKAKEELAEHPEDLDSPDNAGNTPLQVAALNGHANICNYLIKQNCNVHTSNLNKESPLLDAAENGHLDVVRVLLAAGVNPRARNLEGEEPIDRVDDDADDAAAIRQALLAARATYKPTQSSGTIKAPPPKVSDSNAYSNPRILSHSRARKTNEDQLFLKLDLPTLRAKAAIGDENTVMRIIEVLGPRADDAEALVNAAKGGHDNVVNFLLALGEANPDPEPLHNKDPEYATPILAAIGGDSIKVIEVLLGGVDDGRFNPTKKHSGKTYYEIARDRKGPFWQEEERLLKQAYDKFDRSKHSGSSRRSKTDGASRASSRKDPETAEGGLKVRHQRSGSGSKRDKSAGVPESNSKKGPSRPKREDTGNSPVSERESTPKHATSSHQVDTDAGSTVSDTERSKPRRKLISGRDLKGERQRRASIASVKSSASMLDLADQDERPKEKTKSTESSKPRLGSNASDSIAVDRTVEAHRARSDKRDASKDRLSAIRGVSPHKRPRTSPTPPTETPPSHSRPLDAKSLKRRRVEGETTVNTKVDTRSSSSPEHRMSHARDRKTPLRDDSPDAKRAAKRRLLNNNEKRDSDQNGRNTARTANRSSEPRDSKKSSPVLTERSSAEREIEAQAAREKAEAEKAEQEQRIKKEAEELEKQQLEEAKKVEEARLAREAEARRLEEEEIQREKAEKLKREQEEALAKERAEAERLEAERQERIRQEEAEARAKEELERKRLYAEQQRQRREEQERRKAEYEQAQRAEELRIFNEKENARLAKLPPLLRWLDKCEQPATFENASKFSRLIGVRYDTITSNAPPFPESKEQWVLNTQVALLLGEKDLQLSRYTAWERLPANENAKQTLWNLLADDYSMITEDLRKSLHPSGKMIFGNDAEQERRQTFILWKSLDLFFVKVSELMFIVPNCPHLHNLEIRILYKELPPEGYENASFSTSVPEKWKSDPDAHPYLAPGRKTFVNGRLTYERKPEQICQESPTSNKPFPNKRVPILHGVKTIPPGHDLYEQLCREQGLEHLLQNGGRSGMPAGILTNGMTPPDSTGSVDDIRRDSATSSVQSAHNGWSNGVNGALSL